MKNAKWLFCLLIFVICGLLFYHTSVSGVENKKNDQNQKVVDFLKQLEKKTSDFNSLQADFIQEKELSAFKNKLIIKGRVYLLKPAKIAWHVDEPVKYSVIITAKAMKQWEKDTDRLQVISFTQKPVLKTMFSYLNGWFKGDYSSFLKDYDVQILKQNPAMLLFTPKAESMTKRFVQSITICFKEDGSYLKWIKIQDVSADTTTIFMENTVFNAPINSAIWECRRSE